MTPATPADNADSPDLLSRDLIVDATFKFISKDYQAKDLTVRTMRSIAKTELKRALLKPQTDRGDYTSKIYSDLKPSDGCEVVLMIFSLASVDSNKGIQPVWVNSKQFTIPDPTKTAQQLSGDGTAAFWTAYYGGTKGGTAIGIAPNGDGSFQYYNANTGPVLLDVIVGSTPKPPKPTADTGEDTGKGAGSTGGVTGAGKGSGSTGGAGQGQSTGGKGQGQAPETGYGQGRETS